MGVGREALSRSVLRRASVEMPEWGGPVTVRELTAAEQAEVLALSMAAVDVDGKAVRDIRQTIRIEAMMVVYGWIDDTGANVLGPDDLDQLMQQPYPLIQRLAMAVRDAGAGPKV